MEAPLLWLDLQWRSFCSSFMLMIAWLFQGTLCGSNRLWLYLLPSFEGQAFTPMLTRPRWWFATHDSSKYTFLMPGTGILSLVKGPHHHNKCWQWHDCFKRPVWLQEALTVLVALFQWAGLDINIHKTKVMICPTGFIKTHFSVSRYKRRITGEGPSPQLKKTAVNCPKCNKTMNKTSLLAHMETIHGEPCVVLPELPEVFLASHQPQEHVIKWPPVQKRWPCPVEDCPYQAETNTNFYNHFMCRQLYDSIHITDESQAPWPKCELCGLQCPFLPSDYTQRVSHLQERADYQSE